MGPRNSVPEQPTINTGNQVNDDSSGFHLIEFHSGTAGIGIGILILAAVFGAGFFACYLKFRGTRKRQVARVLASRGVQMPNVLPYTMPTHRPFTDLGYGSALYSVNGFSSGQLDSVPLANIPALAARPFPVSTPLFPAPHFHSGHSAFPSMPAAYAPLSAANTFHYATNHYTPTYSLPPTRDQRRYGLANIEQVPTARAHDTVHHENERGASQCVHPSSAAQHPTTADSETSPIFSRRN
jgi:hypothetical protein